MTALYAEDFPAFYTAVHGHDPFPWQADLVATVLASGWPDLVDVPTGLGKTSMIDVAVFVLAATADRPPDQRPGRRRIFFVVDRRLVVDEANDHAQKVAVALAQSAHPVVGRVATGLRSLVAPAEALHFDGRGDGLDEPVLTVTKMRGGSTWDTNWVDRPDQVAVVTGTVDQIGSRFLFRGYGLSTGRMPIDAALTGTDALWLVDEAHLAEPLLETVAAARRLDEPPRTGVDGLREALVPMDVVTLTATSTRSAANPYRIDLDAHREHEVAWRRLTAAKRLNLLLTAKASCPARMAEAAAELAARGARRVLVVCNTVDRAREVHGRLTTLAERAEQDRPVLLIGRSRELDRRRTVGRVMDTFGLGREGPTGGGPQYLVATQTVEVGVNLDADALVTESSSWDALVQRLGRVNRLGTQDRPAGVLVVHDGVEQGPVYGAARDRCWEHLSSLVTVRAELADVGWTEGLDVSPLSCRALATEVPRDASRASTAVPVLLPATLDSWVQTAPVPLNDTPVGQFLHGFDAPLADVTLVFRSGLFVDDGGALPEQVGQTSAAQQLAAVPPKAGEQLQVPFLAARQWLTGGKEVDTSDVEGVLWFLDADPGDEEREVLAQRYPTAGHDDGSGGEQWTWISPAQIKPGDTLVLPAEYGGVDEFGWHPASDRDVVDLAEAACWLAGRHGIRVIRSDAATLTRIGIRASTGAHEDLQRRWSDWLRGLASPDAEVLDQSAGVAVLLAAVTAPTRSSSWLDLLDPGELHALTSWLAEGDVRVTPLVDLRRRPGRRQESASPLWALAGDARGIDQVDDTGAGSSSARLGTGQVTLGRHLANVAARAHAIGAALRLPPGLLQTVTRAAAWHDLGKVEARFQVMLHHGDRLRSEVAAEPLAKSGLPPGDRAAWRAANTLSRLPRGARHELWSAALVEAFLAVDGRFHVGDGDLVTHLVASHHGHARPMFWPVHDGAASEHEVTTTIDGTTVQVASSDGFSLRHVDTFDQLNARHGRWGLALLESVVRAADVTVSREGS